MTLKSESGPKIATPRIGLHHRRTVAHGADVRIVANPQPDRVFFTKAATNKPPTVLVMVPFPRNETSETPTSLRDGLFADLRKRNVYRARVARMLDAKREQHVDRVIQTLRKHRIHQSR